MDAGSHFEVWLVLAIVAVFAGMFLTYLVVELPGRFLIRLVVGDDYEPLKSQARAVGWGACTVVAIIIYAVVG